MHQFQSITVFISLPQAVKLWGASNPWFSDLGLTVNNRLHLWRSNWEWQPEQHGFATHGRERGKALLWNPSEGLRLGTCPAEPDGPTGGPALPLRKILQDTVLCSNLTVNFIFLSFAHFSRSLIYTVGINFFHISKALKSIVEKWENAGKKNKILFTQHAATWRKQSVNIPFPMFLGTFFF